MLPAALPTDAAGEAGGLTPDDEGTGCEPVPAAAVEAAAAGAGGGGGVKAWACC